MLVAKNRSGCWFISVNGSGRLGPARAGWARPIQIKKIKKKLDLGLGPNSPIPFILVHGNKLLKVNLLG